MKKENMIFRLKLEIGELVEEILNKLPSSLFQSSTTRFLDPAMGGGQFVAAIENRLRSFGHSDKNIKQRVFGIEKNQMRINYAINKNKLVGSYIIDNNDIPTIFNSNMKFDAIVGNFPYNAPKSLKGDSSKLGGGTTLWDKFVIFSLSYLVDGGYIAVVHPIGWRSFAGDYKEVAVAYKSNNLVYVGMNNSATGIKVFGAGTAFDIVVCQKAKYGRKTKFLDYDSVESTQDISNWNCIPSGKFDEIMPLIASKEQETCTILYSRTDYGSDKKWISKEKSDSFKYPVVHSVNVKNEPSFIYSSEKRGMIGTPKVIFGRRECGALVDLSGEFACSQDTRAIVDSKENLPLILKCFHTSKFVSCMRYLSWNSTAADKYDKNAISLFRKDFYKDFV